MVDKTNFRAKAEDFMVQAEKKLKGRQKLDSNNSD